MMTLKPRFHRFLSLYLAGASLLLTMLTGVAAQAEPAITSEAFRQKWQRADRAVAQGNTNPSRSWLWGPEAFLPPGSDTEPYEDSPGGKRSVLYFDKARMELNNPENGQVTNGLLVRELISGRMATGDTAFVQRRVAADIYVAGDASNNVGPTYASFRRVASLENDNFASPRPGAPVAETINWSSKVGNSPELGKLARYVYFDPTLKHNIPDVFWNFMNQRGNIYQDGRYIENQPVMGTRPEATWLEAVGYPLTEAYWAKVTVGGQAKDVLVQAYERRVLTFTPANPPAFRVEMGNVGRHYFSWRYNTKYDIRAKPAALTGVNVAGAEFAPQALPGKYGLEYAYPTRAEADYFVGKGMNLFRVPFLWERLQPSAGGDLNQEQLDRLDDFINYATGKGGWIVLDPHNYARYYGKLIGSAEVPVTVFADLWKRVAARYKDNSRVIFGLMNEPTGIPTTQWLAGANAALKAIRSTGAGNLVLVAGNSPPGRGYSENQVWYGTAFGEQMLDIVDPGYNYAYEFHQYLDWNQSGTNEACVSPGIGVERLENFTRWLKEHNQRGFLGEFGSGRNETCYQALDNMLTYLDFNTDVWFGWSYWAAGPLWNDYIFSLEPAGGQDRPQFNVLSKHLHGVELAANQAVPVLPGD